MLQGVVCNPSSASYLDFDWSGNKTEKRLSKKRSNPSGSNLSGSNPSGVRKKLAMTDMLIFAGGATCLAGEDKVGLTCRALVTVRLGVARLHLVCLAGSRK